MRRAYGLLSLLLCTSACVLAPPLYWADEISGKVVDADTRAPIEGAVVLADWKLYRGGIGHGGHRDSLLVEETVTDGGGEFHFGKWGPRVRPMYAVLDTAPWLVVFKAGYEHQFLPNEHDSNGFVRRSDWDGKTIALKPFEGTTDDRLSTLRIVLSVSERQPQMLEQILLEKEQYYRSAPTFFDHVQELHSHRE